MDHNLEDSLNLDSTMGVDFEHSEDVVDGQGNINLDTSTDGSIPMEFEQIEEQPLLMDSTNEEIIVSDFMGDQFTLQEYSVPDDQMTIETTTDTLNQQNLLVSQSDSMLDYHFEPQTIMLPASSGLIQPENTSISKAFTVTSSVTTYSRPAVSKKETIVVSKASVPRQVAIAPKPPRLVAAPALPKKQVFSQHGKQYAIAPKPTGKPITVVGNRPVSFVKKVAISSAGQVKPNTVLTQIGKQLVKMPTGGSLKIKLVSTGPGMPTVRLLGSGDADQAQLKPQTVSTTQGSKQVMKKVILQGQATDPSNQSAVITKILPSSAAGVPPTRYVTMQQKTVPISIGNNKLLLGSPTKQVVAKKQQVISIKSPTPKLVPVSAQQGMTKKVLITANDVILKTTAPQQDGQDNSGNTAGQRTQLHQINVPGKGIQYIRLVTSNTPTSQKQTKPQTITMPSKTFVLTDSKGNLIQMTADKLKKDQPPPLVISGNITGGTMSKLTAKPQQKLFKLAPIASKPAQQAMQARSGQSLLAPLSPVPDSHVATIDSVTELLEENKTPGTPALPDLSGVDVVETTDRTENLEVDSKAALRALIADAVGDDPQLESDRDSRDGDDDQRHTYHQELPIEFHNQQVTVTSERTSGSQNDSRSVDHPLIVIPSFMKQDNVSEDSNELLQERHRDNVNVDAYEYQSPSTPQALSENDVVPSELGLRPRKACNCTKSQCLKLYCDCFANGEFCNRCNCNNCHNNLENEELRQKAIRGCLDRNPNAFRPKIGKSKSGGPEIIRRHNKGCNCKRSGCLKNYCECYEAKIACTSICKCVGCRNVEETLDRSRRRDVSIVVRTPSHAPAPAHVKQPCSFLTSGVVEAMCQCLLAAAVEGGEDGTGRASPTDPVRDVLDEFARCLQDIISAAHQAAPLAAVDETQA